MQNRAITGTIFEKNFNNDGFTRSTKSPRIKYSGNGKSILTKIKNSKLNPTEVVVLDESDFSKYDIINKITNEKWEVKKYQKSNIKNWKLFSEPFFKIATKQQATKINVDDYNTFIDRFWNYNNNINLFDKIITEMTSKISGICIIDEFIPVKDLEFRFVIKNSWRGYKRITLEFKLK